MDNTFKDITEWGDAFSSAIEKLLDEYGIRYDTVRFDSSNHERKIIIKLKDDLL